MLKDEGGVRDFCDAMTGKAQRDHRSFDVIAELVYEGAALASGGRDALTAAQIRENHDDIWCVVDESRGPDCSLICFGSSRFPQYNLAL